MGVRLLFLGVGILLVGVMWVRGRDSVRVRVRASSVSSLKPCELNLPDWA